MYIVKNLSRSIKNIAQKDRVSDSNRKATSNDLRGFIKKLYIIVEFSNIIRHKMLE